MGFARFRRPTKLLAAYRLAHHSPPKLSPAYTACCQSRLGCYAHGISCDRLWNKQRNPSSVSGPLALMRDGMA
eukprot:3879213-Amphidinium_carterae.2